MEKISPHEPRAELLSPEDMDKDVASLDEELLGPKELEEDVATLDRLSAEKREEHPYIVRVPGIASGEPIIKGMRVSVRAIALHYKASETLEEILEAYPHISSAAVFDAVSYYLDHQEEIEALIEENRPERVIEKHGLKVGAKGQFSAGIQVNR